MARYEFFHFIKYMTRLSFHLYVYAGEVDDLPGCRAEAAPLYFYTWCPGRDVAHRELLAEEEPSSR